MASERFGVAKEVRIPPEEIIAEARRWGIADEVGLQVSPEGTTSVLVCTPRGRQFVEYLSLREKEFLSKKGEERVLDNNDCPPFHEILPTEWLNIVKWADQIRADAAAGRRIDAAVALRLARAVLAHGRPDGTTGILVLPADDNPKSQ
jgi:hypothetical protein